MENENVWLTANQMALLFGRDERTVRKHINNAIKEELSDAAVVAKFATTTWHEGLAKTHKVFTPKKNKSPLSPLFKELIREIQQIHLRAGSGDGGV